MSSELSPHLSLSEVEYSDTALQQHIENKLPQELISVWIDFAVSIFEPIRTAFGKPIKIISGYRGHELNQWMVENRGASRSSLHLGIYARPTPDPLNTTKFYQCAALDMFVADPDERRRLWDIVWLNTSTQILPIEETIWEYGDDNAPRWIHFGYIRGRDPKFEILRSRLVGGKPTYRTFDYRPAV